MALRCLPRCPMSLGRTGAESSSAPSPTRGARQVRGLPKPRATPCPAGHGAARHLLQDGLEQYTEGTHRLEEPVSKITVKSWAGVPMEMVPKYSICQSGVGKGLGGWIMG